MNHSTIARVVCGVLLVCAMALASVAQAQERKCRDITFPQSIQVAGGNLTLNGLGVRKATFLKINVYVAALYVVSPTRDAAPLIDSSTAQQLVLHFVRDVGVEDLRKAFLEAFGHNGSDQSVLQARIAKLNSWMADMKTGQSLVFTRVPHTGVQVTVNGVQKGTIEGDDFARAFVAIWLGPSPPNSELKTGLLGGECS